MDTGMFDDEEIADRFEVLLTQVTLAEAVARVPFTVLVPELPTGMKALQYRCSDGSKVSTFVTMVFVGGGRTLAIQQVPATARPHLADETWHEVLIDGTPIKVRGAGERPEAELALAQQLEQKLPGGTSTTTQTQAFVERDGTFAYLGSTGMTTNELATVAVSLRPAASKEQA